jgi:UDP-N-acetylglucosamine kinase
MKPSFKKQKLNTVKKLNITIPTCKKILDLGITQFEMSEILATLRIELFGQSQPEEFPTCYILSGQPSSGKTTLSERIISDFIEKKKPRPVIINGDEFRRFHPHYDEFRQEEENVSTSNTQLFVNALVDYFLEYALEKAYSFIVEGNRRNLPDSLTTIHKAQKKNYRIETHILAVHRERSWVGVHQRYENQKAHLGKGRFTPQELHDAAFDSIPRVTDALYSEPDALNKIMIYTAQAQRIIYEAQRTIGGKWDNKILPSEALHRERKRAMESQEQERISWGWGLVKANQ